jgi:hypothetical protein
MDNYSEKYNIPDNTLCFKRGCMNAKDKNYDEDATINVDEMCESGSLPSSGVLLADDLEKYARSIWYMKVGQRDRIISKDNMVCDATATIDNWLTITAKSIIDEANKQYNIRGIDALSDIKAESQSSLNAAIDAFIKSKCSIVPPTKLTQDPNYGGRYNCMTTFQRLGGTNLMKCFEDSFKSASTTVDKNGNPVPLYQGYSCPSGSSGRSGGGAFCFCDSPLKANTNLSSCVSLDSEAFRWF